jgi:hypothetical protein
MLLLYYKELKQTSEKIVYILKLFLTINFAYILNVFFEIKGGISNLNF